MDLNEAIEARNKLLEKRPELQKAQWELDCKLSHCRSREERARVAFNEMAKSMSKLSDKWQELVKILAKHRRVE